MRLKFEVRGVASSVTHLAMRSCAGALRCSKFCAQQCVYILWKCSS
ncbi:MAG: hypothetical protein HRT56_08445 [Coraliomargarita sp.]|nr:hypothetical protein [Coraliomargarita sp.]